MEALRLGCLGGGARNDSHQVVCRFFMCRFARTQPGGSGLEKTRVAREKLIGLGQGRRIGGGFAPWRLGCLGGGARNDSHQVVCRFFMCRFARTQPGGSGLERARSHARSFLDWDTGVAWAETLSLGAWAALAAAVQNAIKDKR